VVPSVVNDKPEPITINWTIQAALKNLPHDPRFRAIYSPVSIPVAGRYVVTFARNNWIRAHAKALQIHVAAWDEIRFE
jgi:hypothetical protein